MMNDYSGVPADAVWALGAMIIDSGRVEYQVRGVLTELDQDPGSMQVSACLKAIRRRAVSPPIHPRLADATELIRWTHDVRAVLARRDTLVHSVAMRQAAPDGSAQSMATHLRTNVHNALEASNVMEVVVSLHDLTDRGFPLWHQLMRSDTPGVYINHVPSATQQAALND